MLQTVEVLLDDKLCKAVDTMRLQPFSEITSKRISLWLTEPYCTLHSYHFLVTTGLHSFSEAVYYITA